MIVEDVYQKAIKDNEFLAAIKSADNDVPPSGTVFGIEKAVFAAVYYGYRVGIHGDDWNK